MRGDLGAETGLEVLLGQHGVLDRVVEQRAGDGDVVEARARRGSSRRRAGGRCRALPSAGPARRAPPGRRRRPARCSSVSARRWRSWNASSSGASSPSTWWRRHGQREAERRSGGPLEDGQVERVMSSRHCPMRAATWRQAADQRSLAPLRLAAGGAGCHPARGVGAPARAAALGRRAGAGGRRRPPRARRASPCRLGVASADSSRRGGPRSASPVGRAGAGAATAARAACTASCGRALAERHVAGLALLQLREDRRGHEDRRVGTGRAGRRTAPARSRAASPRP